MPPYTCAAAHSTGTAIAPHLDRESNSNKVFELEPSLELG
jgi:hypothetical protein